MSAARVVRIGGASGFWGDTAIAAPQLVASGQVDYLVFDYLAEVTMSILAAQRAKDPGAGYATDFVSHTMRPLLAEIVARKIRVVANAGGVNPLACRDALAAVALELGVPLRIGVVLGDDLLARSPEWHARDVREMASGAALPARLLSVNAYLGAAPIAAALDRGCDVVITGRCVDSAVTLGVLRHEFGWSEADYDRLAQGTLAGHLIECGAQCTGGLFTDWELVPDWENIGFPIVEVADDGAFIVTKPAGTGGLVTTASVAEQMLYEIGDPRDYRMPDVRCDFTQVRFTPAGANRVLVAGARGRVPDSDYKVSATFPDGYRTTVFLTIAGEQAAAKARRTGAAILARTTAMLAARALPAYTQTWVEVLGAEEMYGAAAQSAAREVVLKIAARSPARESLELLAREFAPAATSMAPGTCGLVGGRPAPAPVVRLFSFLLPKTEVAIDLDIDGERFRLPLRDEGGGAEDATGAAAEAMLPPALVHGGGVPAPSELLVTVPLIRLAYARSGDKGNIANIGVIARRPEFLPWLAAFLTPERVAQHFAHRSPSRVERFDLPGSDAMNFVLHDVLGGGGMASLHTDNLAKAYAQVLLAMAVPVPAGLL